VPRPVVPPVFRRALPRDHDGATARLRWTPAPPRATRVVMHLAAAT